LATRRPNAAPATGSPFTPAASLESWLKVFIYGTWGSGKTHFLLHADGPLAIVDSEGGTAQYAGLVPFDVMNVKSNRELLDPVTVFYETLQDAALRARIVRSRAKAERERREFDPDAVDLEMLDWNRITRSWKALMNRLSGLPAHVIVTAREKDETEKRGDQMVKIGVKPDAQKTTAYLFDVVLRASVEGKDRVFTVEKARGRVGEYLPLGSKHKNATFESLFREYLKATPKQVAERKVASDEEAAVLDAADLGVRVAGADLATRLTTTLIEKGYDPEEVRVNRGWPPFAELPAETVENAITRLLAAKPDATPDPASVNGSDPSEEPKQEAPA
jgi:hypothetical protein